MKHKGNNYLACLNAENLNKSAEGVVTGCFLGEVWNTDMLCEGKVGELGSNVACTQKVDRKLLEALGPERRCQ